MTNILNRFLNILKYILFVIMSIILFYGIINSYSKTGKNIILALDLFLPFILGVISIMLNIFSKKSKINQNMFFNLVAITTYTAIIIVGLRANFDYNMISFNKNPIKYNLIYFNENASFIKLMSYLLLVANLIFYSITKKEQKEEIEQL